jgi:hypothetical protein
MAAKDWWTIILCIDVTSQYEGGRLAIPVGSGMEAGGLRRLSFTNGAGLAGRWTIGSAKPTLLGTASTEHVDHGKVRPSQELK